ncbi:hypothetical protein H1R20_g15702, partial [Candolleomyces eurysporus]
MTTTPANPPPFEQHTVQLESAVDSKITGVSVYSDRAEVSRAFRFPVKTGQNQVIISGLPKALNHDSLRVEGKGAGTIQDVTISQAKPPVISTPQEAKTSPELKRLQSNKTDIEQTIHRNVQAQTSLVKYLESLSSQQTPSNKLAEIVSDYDTIMGDLQKKMNRLSEELQEVQASIAVEELSLQAATGEQKKWNPNLSLNVTVGIFASVDGDVELGLIYAVNRTSWTARYDIRVNTQTKEKAVSLVYKASIKQSSGEDWTDVPLTLETATPSFDKTLPNLNPWTIGIYRPPPPVLYSPSSAPRGDTYSLAAPPPPPLPEMSIQTSAITSKGGVSATFAVPGLITIPSDGADHGVTIATLELDAKMSWVSIPKKDTKTYLSAKIKNASEYTLLSGPANVYVDGSFISRSTIPGVSPEEKFDCALGLDPAIRITYHPLSKKLSQSGLLSKSDVYLYTQRITVHNTKPTLVETIKIIDQIPVSEDSIINVKLLSPALQLPSSNATPAPTSNDGGSVKSGKTGGLLSSIGSGSNSNSGNSEKALKAVAKSVKVTSGVVAQWDRPGSDAASATDEGLDSEPVDFTALGKDGKINWLCSVAAQTKTNLTLQWEVNAPVKTNIAGI